MSTKQEYFNELKEWSERKLKIITKYLGGFTRILGNKGKPIYYVDGFAGRGIYDDESKGSPVLAAEYALSLRNSGVSFPLHCINVEADHDNYMNLCSETNLFGSLVENYEGEFANHADSILKTINNSASFFFLDPFGIKDTPWKVIEKVLSRKDITDLWIRFDYKTAHRLLGFFNSTAKDAPGKKDLLQNVLGVADSAQLEELLNDDIDQQSQRNRLVNMYIERLEKALKLYKNDGFAATYSIKTINGQKKYDLIFACSSYKAATLASNVVYTVEEKYEREKEEYREETSGQFSLFTTEVTQEQIKEQKVKKLKEKILDLPKQKPLKREFLHYEVLRKNKDLFGKIGKEHLTEAIKQLSRAPYPKISYEAGTPGGDQTLITILE